MVMARDVMSEARSSVTGYKCIEASTGCLHSAETALCVFHSFFHNAFLLSDQ